MHEFAVTKSMFNLVLQHAEQAGAGRVGKINLVIGEMTGVVGDCVKFYMDFLSKDTVVEGAVLDITMVPVKARCNDCGETFELQEFERTCPTCSSISPGSPSRSVV